MSPRILVRDILAATFRFLPHFRGKQTLGVVLAKLLTDYQRGEECLVTFSMGDGTIMRMDLRTTTAAWSFWTGRYDHRVIEHLSSYLRPGAAVLDVGAHIGFYSIPLARRLKDLGGTLFAFEPIVSNSQALQENVALNGLESVVHVFNVALGNEEGEICLHFRDFGVAPTGNAVIVTGRVGESFPPNATARITTLDALASTLDIRSCSLIKLDIEGYEHEFVKGAITFIERTRPVIYGEFSPYWMQLQREETVGAAHDLLKNLGYRAFIWTKKKGFIVPRGSDLEGGNILFVPADRD